MQIRKRVLRALTSREGYDSLGRLFDASYWSTQEDRQLRIAIAAAWELSGDKEDELPKALLTSALADEGAAKSVPDLYDLPLAESVDIARGALMRWKGEQLLLEASNSLLTSASPDYEELALKFQDLHLAVKGESKSMSYDPREGVAETIRYERDCLKFPTGLTSLDEQLDGGLWAGELAVMMAPPFKGKTHSMVYLGAVSLLNDIPVLHITFEISGYRTIIRYYQSLLKETRDWVVGNPEKVAERISSLNLPDWRVLDYSDRGCGMGEFRRQILQTAEDFGKPPLVVVDYLDLLTGTQYVDGKRFELEDIVNRMRRVASEAGCAIVTGSQVRRDGYDAETIQMVHVAESVSKVEKADVIITLNQSETEHRQSVMRWHIAKARERQLTQLTIPVTSVTAHQSFRDKGW